MNDQPSDAIPYPEEGAPVSAPIPEDHLPVPDTTSSAENPPENPDATVPITVAALPIEHHETLLQRIEGLPEEIIIWVKAELAKARAELEKL